MMNTVYYLYKKIKIVWFLYVTRDLQLIFPVLELFPL